MNKILKNFIFISIGFLSYGMLQGQANPKVSIQGTLKDANGSAVDDGTYSVEFRLYSVESGGTAGWMELASVNVVGGIYSHLLGSIEPLEATIFANTLYLGVKVGAFELVPRSELTYAPYTFSANTAQNVACSGAVGDVKYSILNPTQFAAANGDCWVPMDGGDMTGSALAGILGTTTVPNAGGLFLRSQEFDGGTDYDPNRNSSSLIAQFEDQATANHTHGIGGSTGGDGSHNHNIDFRLSDGSATGDIGNLDGHYPSSRTNTNTNDIMFAASDRLGDGTSHTFTVGTVGNHSHTLPGNTGNNSGLNGQETRPKNMNLWIYIRIN